MSYECNFHTFSTVTCFAQTSTTRLTKHQSHTKHKKTKSFEKQHKHHDQHAHTKQRYYDTHKNNQNDHHDGHDAAQTVKFHKKRLYKLKFRNIIIIFIETMSMIKSMSNRWLYCRTLLMKDVIVVVIFIFVMICNVYCLLSVASWLFVWCFWCFLCALRVMPLILLHFSLYTWS